MENDYTAQVPPCIKPKQTAAKTTLKDQHALIPTTSVQTNISGRLSTLRTMSYRLIIILLSVFFTLPVTLFAQDTASHAEGCEVTASVSPDFPKGLHAKYMRYLGQKLNLKVNIKPMPLARRIKELEKGTIDIIILNYRENPALTFLQPAYSPITEYLFVNHDDKDKITNYRQLINAAIGLNTGSEVFPIFDNDKASKKITVNTLEQKILLLKHNRIDGFFHTNLSTKAVLQQMGLTEDIVKSTWQPQYLRKQSHFVISPNSKLFHRKAELEKIIEQGVANGEFLEIRRVHYKATNK
ncbi:substrate-binding periplasmic protein [Thalassotalea euphylliae]|uniref:Solute-binding protein family 3/N-terminal domain-containing protein n=1 Tax=Thalassotalea euphylliae TaxID=1655234 RepID=A0A3E0UKG5_9GAMM|nr:transporter substrate-binding domain-containing protein [Thalassotalea euphylliae]REL36745.1 hypothetical protein DXX92_16270 [Thalassotalea euphylliae]